MKKVGFGGPVGGMGAEFERRLPERLSAATGRHAGGRSGAFGPKTRP